MKAAPKTAATTEDLFRELWQSTKELGFEQWTKRANEKIMEHTKTFAVEDESTVGSQWSLADSWLFARTIFTTIGTWFAHASLPLTFLAQNKN